MSDLKALNLSVKLATKDGRLCVEELVAVPDDNTQFAAAVGEALSKVCHRMEVLTRDGPWKPEVQNSLQPAPKISDL